MSLLFNNIDCKKVHFIGIFGSGMSAIAQYLRFQNIDVSGSDRFLSNDSTKKIKASLQSLGCILYEQNGSGVNDSTDIVCVSTAIENDNPDIITARNLTIPIVHRSDLLAAIIKTKKTIAVAGTSGKSTVTSMIFEFLASCGKEPSLISGASLKRLESKGYIGNAYCGTSELLVVEADESDGSLVKYEPYITVFLNVSKDHKSIAEVKSLFEQLASRSKHVIKNADDPHLCDLSSTLQFGLTAKSTWHPDLVEQSPMSITLTKDTYSYKLPAPGLHNASNCAAALCVCEFLECKNVDLVHATSHFEGVARRFTVYKTRDDIFIVDDFAHNPEKIKAAMSAAHGISDRVLAVYQPHGFGPTRFLKDDYIVAFKEVFSMHDELFLLPVYYAGGTAQKDISSDDLIQGLGSVPFNAYAPRDRQESSTLLKQKAKKGDCILVMGARDPSLPDFIHSLTILFGGIV